MNKIFEVMLDDQFKQILKNDQILTELEKSKYNVEDEYLQLMFSLNKTLKICGLTCQVLTPVVWSFLYSIQNAFVVNTPIEEKDIDIFLYLLHNGISKIDQNLYQKAKCFCKHNQISYIEAESDIKKLIYYSFRALEMLPQSTGSDERIHYNLDWLTRIASIVCSMTNYPADHVIYDCSLTQCFYYVIQYARKSDTKNEIRKHNTDQINEMIYKRTLQLGEQYYKQNYEGK